MEIWLNIVKVWMYKCATLGTLQVDTIRIPGFMAQVTR